MPDLVARQKGGKVLMATCLDPSHHWDNVLDPSTQTFWMSTGLYPQEILLALGKTGRISSVVLTSTNVRDVRVESCSEDQATNFQPIGQDEIPDAQGTLQERDIQCSPQNNGSEYCKLVISSGWHDFCSIHRIVVEGESAPSAAQQMRAGPGRRPSSNDLLIKRSVAKQDDAVASTKSQPQLEIEIPKTDNFQFEKDDDAEPDAPRETADVGAWQSPRGNGGSPSSQQSGTGKRQAKPRRTGSKLPPGPPPEDRG